LSTPCLAGLVLSIPQLTARGQELPERLGRFEAVPVGDSHPPGCDLSRAEVGDREPPNARTGLESSHRTPAGTLLGMESQREVEFVFEPQAEGGYHVYAPELPGLHTQGEDLEDATENAREALALYVEGLREDGRSLEMGIVRRTLPLPA
jgi:predicted RNase H-like HicB family nuclease